MKLSISHAPLTLVSPTLIELAATDGDGLSRLVVVWSAKTRIEPFSLVNDSTPAPGMVALVAKPFSRASGATVSRVNCL